MFAFAVIAIIAAFVPYVATPAIEHAVKSPPVAQGAETHSYAASEVVVTSNSIRSPIAAASSN